MSEREDFNTGPFCLTCGGDGAGCAKCAVAARDAEWRAAVERVRMGAAPTDWGYEGVVRHDREAHTHNAALDALLAEMEVPHDGQ